MRRMHATTSAFLAFLGGAATMTGIMAGITATGIWAWLAAGFTAGCGVTLIAIVIIVSVAGRRAR